MTSEELNGKLCRIPGVLGARVVFQDGEIAEVHVMADARKQAKEVMLDVKSVLFVCLEQPVDFRKISVALIDTSESQSKDGDQGVVDLNGHQSRIMLVAAYLKKISAERYEAVVEFRFNDKSVSGTATGITMQNAVSTVVSEAFIDALNQLVPEFRVSYRIEMLGSYCVADLTVSEGNGCPVQNLTGAVRRTGDMPWDVSRAMFQAINRKLGRVLSQQALESRSDS